MGCQYRFHIDSIMLRLKSFLAIWPLRDRADMMLLRGSLVRRTVARPETSRIPLVK